MCARGAKTFEALGELARREPTASVAESEIGVCSVAVGIGLAFCGAGSAWLTGGGARRFTACAGEEDLPAKTAAPMNPISAQSAASQTSLYFEPTKRARSD